MSRLKRSVLRPDVARRRLRGVIQRLRGRTSYDPIVIASHRAIFFPIPKVASTTMKAAIAKLLGIQDRDLHKAPFPTIKPQQLELEPYRGFFKFTFVRNPWSRVISAYDNKVRFDLVRNHPLGVTTVARTLSPVLRPGYRVPGIGHPVLHSKLTWDEYIDALCELDDEHTDIHLRSQHWFLPGKNVDSLDFVGRLETFDDDFQVLSEKLGLPERKARTLNRTGGAADPKERLRPEAWRRLAERYATDIRMFGYSEYGSGK